LYWKCGINKDWPGDRLFGSGPISDKTQDFALNPEVEFANKSKPSLLRGNDPMQLSPIAKILLAIVIFNSIASMCAADDASTRMLVEVWHTGDDALTEKLNAALEEAFGKSPDFTPSYGQKPNTLIVAIPTNVDWKEVGKRTRVLSRIEFLWSKNNRILGTSTLACWDDMLARCVEKVVKDAKRAARKIQAPKS